MCTCVLAHTCTCIYMHVCIHVFTYIQMHVYGCFHLWWHVSQYPQFERAVQCAKTRLREGTVGFAQPDRGCMHAPAIFECVWRERVQVYSAHRGPHARAQSLTRTPHSHTHIHTSYTDTPAPRRAFVFIENQSWRRRRSAALCCQCTCSVCVCLFVFVCLLLCVRFCVCVFLCERLCLSVSLCSKRTQINLWRRRWKRDTCTAHNMRHMTWNGSLPRPPRSHTATFADIVGVRSTRDVNKNLNGFFLCRKMSD